MIFGRRGAFIHLPGPDGSVWWSAQVSSSPTQALGLAELIGCYAAEPRAVTILRATREIHALTRNHLLAPVTRQYRDRTVLIGDAAHPVGAGQGASMAVEDALALAQQLQRTDSVTAALAEYDRVRRQRVDKMAKAATANRDAKTAGPIAARLRDLVMPIVFPRAYPRATGWLYDHDPGTLAPAAPLPSAR
jgi:2-polyprenyl-6-methoxyphenol hydroxylase-like FAD-dependent oxidoreductase